jgi:hypothetical protein
MLKLTFSVVAILSLGGCSLFVGGKSPIASVPDADRELVRPGLNEPDEIRLTKPAKVAGVELAAGSVVKHIGERNYRLVSAGATIVNKLPVPAGSEIVMIRADTVDRWNWHGFIQVGAATTYDGFEVEPGDGVFFEVIPFVTPTIKKLQLGQTRMFRGKEYPKGMLFEIDGKGTITGAYTPAEQAARARAIQKQGEREQQCSTQCAIVTEPSRHGVCMMNCREGR